MLKGLFLFFDNQSPIEPVKKVHHDSHRAYVPFDLQYSFIFFLFFILNFLLFEQFLIFFFLVPCNGEGNHESLGDFNELNDVVLEWLGADAHVFGLFFELAELQKGFLLLDKLVDLIEINTMLLLFGNHFHHQIKQLLHRNGNLRPEIRRHIQLIQPQLVNVFLVVDDFPQQVRMPSCDHLEKDHSQRKHVTFCVGEIVRQGQFLQRHVLASALANFVQLNAFIKYGKPKIRYLVSPIFDQHVLRL